MLGPHFWKKYTRLAVVANPPSSGELASFCLPADTFCKTRPNCEGFFTCVFNQLWKVEHFPTKWFTYSFQNNTLSASAFSNNGCTKFSEIFCQFFLFRPKPKNIVKFFQNDFFLAHLIWCTNKSPIFFPDLTGIKIDVPSPLISSCTWLFWCLSRDKPTPEPQIRATAWRTNGWVLPARHFEGTKPGA